MKSLIYITLILTLTSAQVYDWSGRWEVWDAFPLNFTIHKSQCCNPKDIKITQNSSNSSLLDIKFNFTTDKRYCRLLRNEIEIHETIINGQFIDLNRHSPMHGVYGLYRPNNDTISINPGLLGNCRWVLGNNRSIKTNTTDANNAMNWAGKWKIDEVYPSIQDAKCCRPDDPIQIRQDRTTNTISYDLHYNSNRKDCDIQENETIHFNVSVFGGAFIHRHVRAFYLRNESILVESGECVTIFSRTKEDEPSLIINSKLITAISKDISRDIQVPDGFLIENPLLNIILDTEIVERIGNFNSTGNSASEFDSGVIFKSMIEEIRKLPYSKSQIFKYVEEIIDARSSKIGLDREIYTDNRMNPLLSKKENKDLEGIDHLKDILNHKMDKLAKDDEELKYIQLSVHPILLKIILDTAAEFLEIEEGITEKTVE